MPVTLSTESLLKLITEGDQKSFDVLYRAQLPIVRAVTFRLIRDFHQAEEVAQEVLLEIWQLASRFDSTRGSAAAWINQITRTRAIDRIRHSQAARMRDQWDADHSYAGSFDVVAEAAVQHLDVAQIHRGLLSVTPLQREALVLAFFTELSYTDIAVALAIPLPTLKTRVRDGLIRMRKLIEQFEFGDPVAA